MKVYLLYTGGTIGCVGTPLTPLEGTKFVDPFKLLVEPVITQQMPGTTITYDYFTHTLDSTNMQPGDWVLMAQKIIDNYEEHDAFVVLHGTDTMAWTASALSFLLPHTNKPITVTGSQLPLFYQEKVKPPTQPPPLTILYNTDALRNVLGAIGFFEFAMPEVGLYFDDHLYRGNRTVKSNASEFTAFSSPKFPALGEYGVIKKPDNLRLLQVPDQLAISNNIEQVKADLLTIASNINDASVMQFILFPAYYQPPPANDPTEIGPSFMVSLLKQVSAASPKLKGVIFEAYGEGNIPDYPAMRQQLTDMHDPTKGNTILVDCTQVYRGDINFNAYATGAWLKGAGVISGYDMTPIAALTKLIILLARNPGATVPSIEEQMGINLAGELVSYYSLSGYQNEFLLPTETLFSVNGQYKFSNEEGGRLALYDLSTSTTDPVWSQENGQNGRLVMQADCNLVFYSDTFDPLFASNTGTIGTNAYFKITDEGKLSIIDLYTNKLIGTLN